MEPPSDPARSTVRLDSSRAAADPQPARDDVPDRSRTREGERSETRSGRQSSPNRRPWFRHRRVVLGGALVLMVAVVLIALWWWYESGLETTDDAFLDTHIVDVSPQVAGQVVRVLVDDNQLVRAGQMLVEIDPAQFRLSLQQALAAQQQAQTALGQATAGVAVAQASLAQARADLASATATAVRAQRDLRRYQTLRTVNSRAVARSTVDEAIATARSAGAQQRAAQQRVQSAQAQIKSAEAAVAGARAGIATAAAGVGQARLSLGYTSVVARVGGHIASRTVAVGTYVTPGQQMMAIVPLHLWVRANFKENRIAKLRPGQIAKVHIDACPGADARGHVVSIQRGAGQAFALLPPENATGNYIKVVQRVPVRIALDSVPAGCVLGPGMSVEPTIRVR
ncbi:MAG TPA: HlyD family secretion protein [Steroidobacteraceae bacterium]|nr:HlyD family secretion protein [Steroidobacteraceae bacterium]